MIWINFQAFRQNLPCLIKLVQINKAIRFKGFQLKKLKRLLNFFFAIFIKQKIRGEVYFQVAHHLFFKSSAEIECIIVLTNLDVMTNLSEQQITSYKHIEETGHYSTFAIIQTINLYDLIIYAFALCRHPQCLNFTLELFEKYHQFKTYGNQQFECSFIAHFGHLFYIKSMKKVISLICLLAYSILVSGDAILNNLPVTFSMLGSTKYSPDSGGQQNGYSLTLGYVGMAWLGVQFVNTGGNSDFLVLEASDFYTSDGTELNTGHQVKYTDYYSVSKASGLNADTITTYDASSYTYTQTKTYNLQIKRYAGSNNGQDWDGNANKYSIQQICFYTSDLTFDSSTYNAFYSACYYYEINNYISTFVGEYLKSFILNGYNTSIFGYIDGPIVTSKVYLYQQTQLLGYSTPPAGIIEIGTTTGNFGQDYYAYSPISSECGDYYGESITQMRFDNNAKGFQNPALTINHWNANPATQISGLSFTALRISFNRAVYTYDDYDKSMLSTFLFCFYLFASGSINGALSDKACEVVELSPVYLQMGLAAPSSQQSLFILLIFTVMIMICMF